jgi:hypothetical protein
VRTFFGRSFFGRRAAVPAQGRAPLALLELPHVLRGLGALRPALHAADLPIARARAPRGLDRAHRLRAPAVGGTFSKDAARPASTGEGRGVSG